MRLPVTPLSWNRDQNTPLCSLGNVETCQVNVGEDRQRQMDRDRWTDGETDGRRQRDRQTDRQTDTVRQTDRQTGTKRQS